MELKKEDGLLLEALIEGPPTQGFSTFLILFKNATGNHQHALIGCKPNFAESVTKTFRHITGLKPPGWDMRSVPKKVESDQGDQAETPKVEGV